MIDRIHAFRAALQDAAAEQRVPALHGDGLFAPSVREVYDMNYLRAEHPAPAQDLIADAERLVEDYFHKRVILERADAQIATGFRAHGWTVVPHLIMARTRDPDRRVDTSMVREVSFDDLTAARREVTVGEPWGDDEISSLLDDAKRLIMRAVPTRFFAAFADDEVAAYCEVRSDGTVAQIEDVNTLPRFRGRGLGVQSSSTRWKRHARRTGSSTSRRWLRNLDSFTSKLGYRVRIDRPCRGRHAPATDPPLCTGWCLRRAHLRKKLRPSSRAPRWSCGNEDTSMLILVAHSRRLSRAASRP